MRVYAVCYHDNEQVANDINGRLHLYLTKKDAEAAIAEEDQADGLMVKSVRLHDWRNA